MPDDHAPTPHPDLNYSVGDTVALDQHLPAAERRTGVVVEISESDNHTLVDLDEDRAWYYPGDVQPI